MVDINIFRAGLMELMKHEEELMKREEELYAKRNQITSRFRSIC